MMPDSSLGYVLTRAYKGTRWSGDGAAEYTVHQIAPRWPGGELMVRYGDGQALEWSEFQRRYRRRRDTPARLPPLPEEMPA